MSPGGTTRKSAFDVYQEAQTKKRRIDAGVYRNCEFILGSVAVVERLWSQAKHVLTEERANMEVELVEAILYLKYNSDLWDKDSTMNVYRSLRAAEAQQED